MSNTRTIIRSPGAIVAGSVATAGAIGLLLSDAIISGHWTQDHALVPVVIGLTVATGHLAATALRGGKVLSAVGFAIAFAVGTAITVLNGMGRQSEGIEAKVAEVSTHNAAISAKKAEIEKATARRDQAERMAEKEMTGERCGPRCNDWKLRAKEVAAHLKALDDDLAKLGAPKPVNVKAAKVAAIASAFGYDGKQSAALVILIEPVLLPFLLEWTAIFSFGFGIGHARKPRPRVVEIPSVDVEPDPPGTRETAIDWIKAYEQKHGHKPKLREIQATFGLPKTTAHRYRLAA